jgi:hypothetical protein
MTYPATLYAGLFADGPSVPRPKTAGISTDVPAMQKERNFNECLNRMMRALFKNRTNPRQAFEVKHRAGLMTLRWTLWI